MAMRVDIITLFPELFVPFVQAGVTRRAYENGQLAVKTWSPRDYAEGNYKRVDDRPFGGGPGMVMLAEPLAACLAAVRAESGLNREQAPLVYFSPVGEVLNQSLVQRSGKTDGVVLLCGRYEGFDERISVGLKPLEVSVGDFICNGGEVPAMMVIDTVIRLIPGVLGEETSLKYESFNVADLVEYPQYTRPREFRGMTVPEVLLGGNHLEIARWREQQSLERTRLRRDVVQTIAVDAAPLMTVED